MTPTGIVAVVLGIVIVVLSVALLIIWFRGNKKSRSLIDDRKRLENTASGLWSQINDLKKNLAFEKNSGEECAALTKEQAEKIINLENELQKLQQRHKAWISEYENALKSEKARVTKELNTANDQLRVENKALSEANERLTRENKALSEANERLIKEKEELSKEMENSITVKDVDKYKDFTDNLTQYVNSRDISELGKYIRQKRDLFVDSIESGALIQWIKDRERIDRTPTRIVKGILMGALVDGCRS